MKGTQGQDREDGQALPHLLAIAEVAEHLNVTVRHVRRLVADRRIPYLKWGHLLRFDPAELRAWLDAARMSGREGSRSSR